VEGVSTAGADSENSHGVKQRWTYEDIFFGLVGVFLFEVGHDEGFVLTGSGSRMRRSSSTKEKTEEEEVDRK